jgi:hypothetical protein
VPGIANSKIEVIGVYPIEASEAVHLVELWIRGARGIIDLGKITQATPGQPRENWQVPYDERILNASGDAVVAEGFEVSEKPELWQGDVRIVFFFHYLDFAKPLITPFGNVPVVMESELPQRLSMIEYEEP